MSRAVKAAKYVAKETGCIVAPLKPRDFCQFKEVVDPPTCGNLADMKLIDPPSGASSSKDRVQEFLRAGARYTPICDHCIMRVASGLKASDTL